MRRYDDMLPITDTCKNNIHNIFDIDRIKCLEYSEANNQR